MKGTNRDKEIVKAKHTRYHGPLKMRDLRQEPYVKSCNVITRTGKGEKEGGGGISALCSYNFTFTGRIPSS